MSLALLSVYEHYDHQSLLRANWFFSSIMRVVRGEKTFLAEVSYGDAEPQVISPDVLRFRSPNCVSQCLRVYNELLSRVPPECDKILFIEPSVFFLNPDWLSHVSAALDRHPVVSLFAREIAVSDPKSLDFNNWFDERSFNFWNASRCSFRLSLPAAMASHVRHFRDECRQRVSGHSPCDPTTFFPLGKPGSILKGRHVSTTFAWGFRRNLLERFGLYDRILVNHDLLSFNMLASAIYDDYGAIGADEETSPRVCSDEYLAPYFDWAFSLGEHVGQHVGFADNVALRIAPRVPRDFSMRMEGFDPLKDLEVKDGMLVWKVGGDSPAAIERYNLKTWNYLGRIKH